MFKKTHINIIGAGLAGSEAALQIANRGIQVNLYEMRPERSTKAHQTHLCAELVCSNSLKSSLITNAAGLLKREMALFNSVMIAASQVAEVPAGNALAVDRQVFAEFITKQITEHSNINLITQEVVDLAQLASDAITIVASGPLTSPLLTENIEKLTGEGNLAFFDAIAPIFFTESIDQSKLYRMSRYEQSGNDYLNIPLEKDDYYSFIEAVQAAEKYTGNEAVENDSLDKLDKLRDFDACMPIEDILERGPNTLRFGPMKPKGLINPATGKMPYAAIQLRQEDKGANTYSMVGMQTRMKRHEQEKIFRLLPGLEKVEFARYGSFHRNTFIDSPNCLKPSLEFHTQDNLFFAGQIIGTEGYIESAMGGILAGINASRKISDKPCLELPDDTAGGSIFNYISNPECKNFQPINITYGIMPSYFKIAEEQPKTPKLERRKITSQRALKSMEEFISREAV